MFKKSLLAMFAAAVLCGFSIQNAAASHCSEMRERIYQECAKTTDYPEIYCTISDQFICTGMMPSKLTKYY